MFLLDHIQVHFHNGDYIIRQGAVGDTFYIIVSGQVRTTLLKYITRSAVLSIDFNTRDYTCRICFVIYTVSQKRSADISGNNSVKP